VCRRLEVEKSKVSSSMGLSTWKKKDRVDLRLLKIVLMAGHWAKQCWMFSYIPVYYLF